MTTSTFSTERLGEVVLNALATSIALGHSSPAQSVIYMGADEPESLLLRDILAVCLGPEPEASTRLEAFVEEQGLADKIAQAVTR